MTSARLLGGVTLTLLLAASSVLPVTHAQEAPDDDGEGADPEQVDTDSSTGTAGDTAPSGSDGSDIVDPAPDGPDVARRAAEANDRVEAEVAAGQPEPDGAPMVPQRPPDRPDIADGSGPDPLATTAPPADRAVEGAAPDYVAPATGTDAELVFEDAAARDAALPPYLQYEIETAARHRVVRLDPATVSDALTAENVTVELFDGVTARLATSIAPSGGALDSELYAAGESGADMSVVTVTGDSVLGQFWVDGVQ